MSLATSSFSPIRESAADMFRSLALLCALFMGDALAGNITIPTDDCTWREETYGAWNQCFGNEIVIGKETITSSFISN